MNLAHLLADAARGDGERTALLHEGAQIDYAELETSAARFAGLLRATRIGPGDRVALLLPNEPAYVAAYYGALKLGAIVVPLNPMLKRGEIETRVGDSGAAVLIAAPGREDELAGLAAKLVDPAEAASAKPVAEIVEREPGETAVILYTSGTSGGAKGAELTHRGLLANARFLAGPLLQLTPDDVLLGSPPLTHVLGQSGVMNAAIAARATVALMSRFDAAKALELMRAEGANVILGVPTMCIALLREAESLPTVPQLRVAHIGGAALAPETLHAFADRFGCEVVEGYGMTEIAGCVAAFRFGDTIKAGSVGRPADGVELRVEAQPGEVGEVLIRSNSLLSGYWGNPEATSEAFDEDGWFATEDLGYLDADGCLFLVDRKKDVILRGGYTVYPREIEDILQELPSVHEVAVVGVPDETFGEEIVALVVLKGEGDPEEIKEFVRQRVAGYKYPRLVVAVDALPKGPSGKILKRAIDREPFRKELSTRSLPK